ncbi:MAG: NAD-dependent epimerase/dehydratase family protein [Elusimicrobia bacterium]|nr:NAD-dependent epimerase/dehydratase family protein [Elusimicrobiota bacterium]
MNSVMIAGSFGPLAHRVQSALRAHGARVAFLDNGRGEGEADVLLVLCGPGEDLRLGSLVPALASFASKARRVWLVTSAPPTPDALIVEDSLRYLSSSLAVRRVAERDTSAPNVAAALAEAALASPAARPSPVFLVTGAAGQIGRAMTALLDREGIAHLDVTRRPSPGAFACDLSDPSCIERLAEFCRSSTHVVHLAARISAEKDLARSYSEQFAVNAGATLNLLKALPASVRHISFASSFTVYGAARTPAVDEHHPLQPTSGYALGKLAAERYLADYAGRSGTALACLRYTSVFGPGPAPGRAIPSMIERLLDGLAPQVYGDGRARRDYLYVDDVCRATLAASLKDAEGVFNVGSGVGTSTAELARTLVRLSVAASEPVFLPLAPGTPPPWSIVYDIGKTSRVLGVEPAVSLEEGLRRTMDWLRTARTRACRSL